MNRWWKSLRRPLATLAAIAGFAMAAIYVTVMIVEGNNGVTEATLGALAMCVAATLSLRAPWLYSRQTICPDPVGPRQLALAEPGGQVSYGPGYTYMGPVSRSERRS